MIKVNKKIVIIPDDIKLPFPPSLKAESFINLSEPFKEEEIEQNGIKINFIKCYPVGYS